MYKLLTQQIGRQLRRQYATTSISASAVKNIDVGKSLDEWQKKLRDAGVGDIDFNLKCLVAHVLKRKFVSHMVFMKLCKQFHDLKSFPAHRICYPVMKM